MGCLAEIGVQSYLTQILADNNLQTIWEVRRYDDIRTDGFSSAAGEWDLRIHKLQDNSFLSVECRSSMMHNRSLVNGLATCNIIGPYASVAKSGESYKDIYFLPLFAFLDHSTETYEPLNFERLLIAGRVTMHLVGGCLEMLSKQGTTGKVIRTRGNSISDNPNSKRHGCKKFCANHNSATNLNE